MPGESVTLRIKNNYQEMYKGIDELCFECLAPDSELEIKTENNSLCKTLEIVGIDNLQNSEFTIYPNPVLDRLTLKNPDLSVEKIIVFDLQGKMVYNQQVNSTEYTIDVSHFKPGVYLMRLISGSSSVTRKIVKQ